MARRGGNAGKEAKRARVDIGPENHVADPHVVFIALCCPCSPACEQWLTAVETGGAQVLSTSLHPSLLATASASTPTAPAE